MPRGRLGVYQPGGDAWATRCFLPFGPEPLEPPLASRASKGTRAAHNTGSPVAVRVACAPPPGFSTYSLARIFSGCGGGGSLHVRQAPAAQGASLSLEEHLGRTERARAAASGCRTACSCCCDGIAALALRGGAFPLGVVQHGAMCMERRLQTWRLVLCCLTACVCARWQMSDVEQEWVRVGPPRRNSHCCHK